MKIARSATVLLLAGAAACSGLVEVDDAGVVALLIFLPSTNILEQGQMVTLRAEAIDRNGTVVDVPLLFRTPDTTLAVEETTGAVTALRGSGTGRVQVRYEGSARTLISDFLSFTLSARGDTLILVSPDSMHVAVDANDSAPLIVRLESFEPAGPLTNRRVSVAVVDPTFVDPATRSVELSTLRLVDTLLTTTTGTPSISPTLRRRAGVLAPDRAVVEIRAHRADGTPVPGSGQRVVVRFVNP